MKIYVHIKDKTIAVQCAEGAQRIRWLGDVAIFRYDHFNAMLTGVPKGIKLENGMTVPMDGIICEQLQDEQHVWVILKEDMEAFGLDKQTSNKTKSSQSEFRIRPSTAISKPKKN